MDEQHLERCAKEAYPDGSEQERDEFKRYWRGRIDRERERWDRERERSDVAAQRWLQEAPIRMDAEADPNLSI